MDVRLWYSVFYFFLTTKERPFALTLIDSNKSWSAVGNPISQAKNIRLLASIRGLCRLFFFLCSVHFISKMKRFARGLQTTNAILALTFCKTQSAERVKKQCQACYFAQLYICESRRCVMLLKCGFQPISTNTHLNIYIHIYMQRWQMDIE